MTAIIIAVITVSITGVYFVSAQTMLTKISTTQEEQEKFNAMDIARTYIVTSNTFAFDGLQDTLDMEQFLYCSLILYNTK
jgi:hypothetical protein